jgi:hypothetical protein
MLSSSDLFCMIIMVALMIKLDRRREYYENDAYEK